MGEASNAFRILRKRSLGRPKRWEDNIKTDKTTDGTGSESGVLLRSIRLSGSITRELVG